MAFTKVNFFILGVKQGTCNNIFIVNHHSIIFVYSFILVNKVKIGRKKKIISYKYICKRYMEIL